MSMLDSFFKQPFKAARCKTLLKLTIPRIKLLRNRREVQIKHMRKDIAKLLETGQEATARIRVEHIIREEKMMAAQEIIELFCELIAVRLPIIEAQRECPLDLKEAISSLCFSAPRCADLTELIQVQMLFSAKYGKEFVTAATELLPECGVNRKLVELLSVRAPAPDVKLKLLKEIAEEYELDWDPAASESELLKPHEDLLNGPSQYSSGSKLPLPKEKQEEPSNSHFDQVDNELSDSGDLDFESFDLPEVPKASLRPSSETASAPQMLQFPPSALSELDIESNEKFSLKESQELTKENSDIMAHDLPDISVRPVDNKQFVPFLSHPSFSSGENIPTENEVYHHASSTTRSEVKSRANVDLQDVLAAAQAAAESAERAAAAARSAASLAQVRIKEITEKRADDVANVNTENLFHTHNVESDAVLSNTPSQHQDDGVAGRQGADVCMDDKSKLEVDSSELNCRPQRLSSMDDDKCYPNLFTRQDSNTVSEESQSTSKH